ncbi:Sodium-coupled monocarboxylate transporter 1 [Halocaridina rubra]|uniref:Sodium-coupled monocarboxylate transporter 1 n=1 Tax=Halocaridina rubra TaxID=373956 RepID=A0AAN8XTN9_HALRR
MAMGGDLVTSSGGELVSFGIVDYIVFTVMLCISMGIGVFFAFRGNKNTEDFLMGGRQMSVVPVAISLLSSFISAISILGYSGETYANGMQLSMILSGAFIGIFLASKFFLPVFHPLKLTSVNEYIELRYSSKALRLTTLGISVFIGFFYTGLCLYAPTLALASVTPISSETYIVILGIVCTIYSAAGGLKAVVWTDTFQMIVILMGIVSVIIVGCIEVGGISNVWAIAGEYGRTQLFEYVSLAYANFQNNKFLA